MKAISDCPGFSGPRTLVSQQHKTITNSIKIVYLTWRRTRIRWFRFAEQPFFGNNLEARKLDSILGSFWLSTWFHNSSFRIEEEKFWNLHDSSSGTLVPFHQMFNYGNSINTTTFFEPWSSPQKWSLDHPSGPFFPVNEWTSVFTDRRDDAMDSLFNFRPSTVTVKKWFSRGQVQTKVRLGPEWIPQLGTLKYPGIVSARSLAHSRPKWSLYSNQGPIHIITITTTTTEQPGPGP